MSSTNTSFFQHNLSFSAEVSLTEFRLLVFFLKHLTYAIFGTFSIVFISTTLMCLLLSG